MSTTWGPFTLGAPLGTGGLADVVTATAADGRAVALKRLHRHVAAMPALRALFADEQALAVRLPPHPRLATGVAAGEVDGLPYLAMTLAPGRTLRALGTLPWPGARQVLRDACDALTHLHAHGVVHGDVGPSNLVVDDTGRAVLIDLGVARPLGAGGPVRGTAAYMAPEQVRGEAWTAATDVFALGVLLWELASGARLFARPQTFLSQAAVVEATAPPLLDPALDVIAQAALRKDPASRLATPAMLSALLA